MGKTCILITHKLDEVMEISDRVTVMRKGKVVAERDTKDVDSRELSRLMVGKSVLFDFEKRSARGAGVSLSSGMLPSSRRDRIVPSWTGSI